MEEGRFIEEATAILRGRMEGVMDLSTMAYIAVGPGLSPEATMGALTTGAFTQFGPLTPGCLPPRIKPSSFSAPL